MMLSIEEKKMIVFSVKKMVAILKHRRENLTGEDKKKADEIIKIGEGFLKKTLLKHR